MPIAALEHGGVRVSVLDDDAVRRLHAATLEVIEAVGVRFPSARAQAILQAHGATVDHATNVVKIPASAVEGALAQAPREYVLAACDPALDLPLDGRHTYLGTDGCGVEVLDAFTGERRRSTLRDVADAARVADGLEGIAFHWTPVSAQDCPPESRSLHELLAIWNVSRKHVQTESIVTAREAEAAVEMAAALAGGRAALRQRPVLSIMECTLAPLAQDGGSLEAALVAAEAGLPVGFMTMAACASTGPATLAGNLVVGNAEVLSALALLQMAYPGCPVFYAAAQTAMDLRTGAYTGGGPEDYLFGAATNALAEFYSLPLSMGAFATGAKEPGWQSAVDNSLSAAMAAFSGADMLLGAGLLHGSRILSFEMLVMDAEIWSVLRAMSRGITVDDESLALDTIRRVGPGGTFLAERHTKQHMRALWRPTLFDRRPYGAWEAQRDGAREWARQQAQDLLGGHHPPPLDERQAAELRRVIAAVEALPGS